MNLPTQSGYYWIVQNIGMTVVRTVAHIIVKDGQVLVRSTWDPVYRSQPSPDWNNEIIIQQYKVWNSNYVGWEGPLPAPETLISVKTGRHESWLKAETG